MRNKQKLNLANNDTKLTWIQMPPQNANTIAITFHVFPDHRIIVVSLSNTENLLFVNQGEGKMTRNKNNTRKPPFIITIQVSSVLQSCSQRRTTTIIQGVTNFQNKKNPRLMRTTLQPLKST